MNKATSRPIVHGMAEAAQEHLLSGSPLTRLEALVFFGVSNLPDVVAELRKKGFHIRSQSVPFAKAVVRVNKVARLEPPASLPTREIHLTEYWLSK